jgi:hypothetical protein
MFHTPGRPAHGKSKIEAILDRLPPARSGFYRQFRNANVPKSPNFGIKNRLHETCQNPNHSEMPADDALDKQL